MRPVSFYAPLTFLRNPFCKYDLLIRLIRIGGLTDQYNQYFDKLINCHIDNILFEVMNDFVQAPVKPYPKIKNKLPENKFIKYTTKDIFTGKETYIYENLRTLEKISSNNPNVLEELDAPKKKKVKKKKEVGVPISSMTFSFKKEK